MEITSPSPSYTFRAAQIQDLPDLVDVYRHNSNFSAYITDIEHFRHNLNEAIQRPDALIWVAVWEQRAVGFAWIEEKAAFARSSYLKLLAVAPTFQGHGIGNALLRHFEKATSHPAGLFLLTSDSNSAAQRFYERHGYQRIGIIPHFVLPDVHEVIYYKSASALAQNP